MKYTIYHNGEHIGTCCVQGMEQARDFAQGLSFVPVDEDTQPEENELARQILANAEALEKRDQPLIAPEHEESARNLVCSLAIGGTIVLIALIGHILGLN